MQEQHRDQPGQEKKGKTVRAFIAIEVDPAITALLTALQQEWRRAEADVAWVRPEGMHLTLKFLGNTPEERIAGIGDTLSSLAAHFVPFTVTFAGAGGFPNFRHPRVLWAGVTDGREMLVTLAQAVDDAMASCGFPRESRPFHPHLTLGRVKSPTNLAQLLPHVEAHADEVFGAMLAARITLMRSELSPHGARYTPLRRIPLDGA